MTHDLETTHPHLLFVYGTLKRGNGNYRVIQSRDGVFVAPAATKEKFLLNDGFPFVWARPDPCSEATERHLGRVRGDLFRVSDEGLEACDRLEGHPHSYCRTPIQVEYLQDGVTKEVTAGIYLSGHTRTRGVSRSFYDLQKPDKEGFLEWGRDEPDTARNFQRSRR